MFKRLGKKGEEDVGDPKSYVFVILLILATVAALIYGLWVTYRAFLPK